MTERSASFCMDLGFVAGGVVAHFFDPIPVVIAGVALATYNGWKLWRAGWLP